NTDDLFVGKTLLHGDVLMWLMKTLLTSGCTNQRGAGHAAPTKNKKLFSTIINTTILFVANMLGDENVISVHIVPYKCGFLTF
uniref:hypothetical protein n=1 Tax=Enterobacter hormaechei TaxID=158836 RepID=UPI00352440DE